MFSCNPQFSNPLPLVKPSPPPKEERLVRTLHLSRRLSTAVAAGLRAASRPRTGFSAGTCLGSWRKRPGRTPPPPSSPPSFPPSFCTSRCPARRKPAKFRVTGQREVQLFSVFVCAHLPRHVRSDQWKLLSLLSAANRCVSGWSGGGNPQCVHANLNTVIIMINCCIIPRMRIRRRALLYN